MLLFFLLDRLQMLNYTFSTTFLQQAKPVGRPSHAPGQIHAVVSMKGDTATHMNHLLGKHTSKTHQRLPEMT